MESFWTCKFRSERAIVCIVVFTVVFLACCQDIDSKVDSELESQLALTKDSKTYETWLKTATSRYTKFYFWNWTNPEQLQGEHQAKPNFVEFGPYVFRETRYKVGPNSTSPDDIQWNENGTVTFRQLRTWHFEPSLSNGSLDDEVVTLNVPVVTLAFACLEVCGSLSISFLDYLLRSERPELSVKRKVRELLFEGYWDQYVTPNNPFPPIFPDFLKFDRFGWFYKRNNSASYDGVFNMKTGVDDIQNLGVLANWNYKNRTRFYQSNCGMVNGSAGELFSPKKDKSSISLFSSEIRRTIDLNFKTEVEVNGTRGYRYSGDDETFANQTTKPENSCWCPPKIYSDGKGNSFGECPPRGAVDVSTCKWGTPAHISFPHFLHADPYYTDAVEGMKPDPEKHQTFVDIEPETGVPLNVSATFQINILLDKFPGFEFFENVPKVYIPILWFKQTSF